MTRPLRIISWNIAHRLDPWCELLETDADLALLQEAGEPPSKVRERIGVDSQPWLTAGAAGGSERRWRAAVVRLTDSVAVEWITTRPVGVAPPGELAVSRQGTLAAARVMGPDLEPLLVVSMYAAWEEPHQLTGSSWIYADGSAHRVVSDLSALIGRERGHRIVAAGDLNVLHGHGEHGSKYWAARYETVFSRTEALGLTFQGPQAPHGRQAAPWPNELPRGSRNVPTYHTNRQTPATATRQLDFVFASRALANSISVRARNEPHRWGSSDHCRVEIVVV